MNLKTFLSIAIIGSFFLTGNMAYSNPQKSAPSISKLKEFILRESLELPKDFKIKAMDSARRWRKWLFKPSFKEKVYYRTYDVLVSGTNPITQKIEDQKIVYHKHDDNKVRPLIVVVPPITDVTIMGILVARGFLRRGYNVMVMYLNQKMNDLSRPISDMNNATSSVISGLRRILDFAETRPEIDSQNIGTWGTSLGAIVSAYGIGLDKRIKASYIIAGGGNFPEVMATSEQFIVKRYRKNRMKLEKIPTVKEYKEKISSVMKFDPLYFANSSRRDDVFMVLALNDKGVPTKNQLELWEKFGRSDCRAFKKDHFQSIMHNNGKFYRDFYDFFAWKLKGEKRKFAMTPGKCLTRRVDIIGKFHEKSPYEL